MSISSLENLPKDIFTEIRPYLRVKTFFSLSAASRTLHQKILAVFAENAEAFSDFCSAIVKYNTGGEALRAVRKLQNPNTKLSICLKTKLHHFDKVEKLIDDLPELDSLIVTNKRKYPGKGQHHLPRTKKLTLCDNIGQDSFFLAEQKSLTTLKIPGLTTNDAFIPMRLEYLVFGGTMLDEERSIEDWQSYFQIRSQDRRREFIAHHPHFIPAKLDFASDEPDDATAIKILEEVVSNRPDLPRAHFLLGKRPHAEARNHLNLAVELYEKEGDAEGLFDVAEFLQSKDLAHRAYKLLSPKSSTRSIQQLLTIDPRHIAARLERAGHFSLNETLTICMEEKDLAGLTLLYSYLIEPDKKKVSKLAPSLFSALDKISPFGWDSIQGFIDCIDLYLEQGRPIDTLLRYFVALYYAYPSPDKPIITIYWHLLRKELKGAPLFDLSLLNEVYPKTRKEDPELPQLLHRLERRVRCDRDKLRDQIPSLAKQVNGYWWIYLFLMHHSRLPEFRIEILKSLVQNNSLPIDTGTFSRAKPVKGTTLLASTQTDDPFDLGDDTLYLPFNARFELAKALLLKRKAEEANALLESLIPYIEHFADPSQLKEFHIFFHDARAACAHLSQNFLGSLNEHFRNSCSIS